MYGKDMISVQPDKGREVDFAAIRCAYGLGNICPRDKKIL